MKDNALEERYVYCAACYKAETEGVLQEDLSRLTAFSMAQELDLLLSIANLSTVDDREYSIRILQKGTVNC